MLDILSLTKTNVGLGSVDNVQQASKTEFNTHIADTYKHKFYDIFGATGVNHATGNMEGAGTIASGNSSHAECSGTTASGLSSHAEGSHSEASGTNSHAEGCYSEANGNNSHAEGFLY